MRLPLLLALLLLACVAAVAARWSARPPVTLDELASTDPGIALAANQRVEESPLAAEPVLLQGLSSPSARARALCAHHVGRMRLHAAIPGLQRLLHDPVVSVRVQAASSLRVLRDWTDVAAVQAVAADAGQPVPVREALLRALGRRHEHAACDLLMRVVVDPGEDDIVRSAAVDALGCVAGDRDDALAAAERLACDGSAEVCLSERAAMSIANMRRARSLSILEGLVDDVSLRPKVRARAAAALGRLGDPRAIPFLQASADDFWKPLAVRIDAITALAELGVVHPHPFVEQALDDPSTYVREAAVRAILRCHDVDMVDALTEAAAREKDGCVHEQMLHAAGRLMGELEQEEP